MILKHFIVQLTDFDSCPTEFNASPLSNRVDASCLAFDPLLPGNQNSPPFHFMEHRIKGAGADAVAVASKLGNHSQPENGFGGRVVKHMEPNEPRAKILFGHGKSAYSGNGVDRPRWMSILEGAISQELGRYER